MKILRIARQILLGFIILGLAAIPIIALLTTASNWNGTCYGFTDGEWTCPWTEYAFNQMGYMALFSFFPLFFTGGLWIFLSILWFLLKKQPLKN